jgi:hypothetical protein
MTDKTGLTDLTRDYATSDGPHAHRVPERLRWSDVMMHYLPALVVPQMPTPSPDSAPE